MSTIKPKLTAYRCALCGRRLREGYIYSRFTKNRYCPPGHCRGELGNHPKTQGGRV